MFCKKGNCNEKETPTQVLSCEINENLKNIYFEELLRTYVSDQTLFPEAHFGPNLKQNIVEKLMKLSKIDFSIKCFTAGFS